jgi:signal transduction histidine kinase
MKPDSQLGRAIDILPEPILFVDRSGIVRGANSASRELLQINEAGLTGKPFAELISEPPPHADAYLRSCSRSAHMSIGALTFKTASGALIPCRCEGGVLPPSRDESPLLLIRHIPKPESMSRFLELNEQINFLHRVRQELEGTVAARTHDLRAAQSTLRELSANLLQAQDDERRRLARELHDSTGQLLTAIQLNLSMLMEDTKGGPAQFSAKLSKTIELTNQAISEIRTMSYLLHPPMLDEAGLAMALQWYVEGFEERSKIAVDLEVAPGLHRLGRDLEISVFRIVQECLTNVHRHSGSRQAQIRITLDQGRLKLTVSDQGRGFAPGAYGNGNPKPAKVGVGIRGMCERVRQLNGTIDFFQGKPGTVVSVQFPVSTASAPTRNQAVRQDAGRDMISAP